MINFFSFSLSLLNKNTSSYKIYLLISIGTIGPEVNDVVIPNQASLYRIDSDLKPKKELSPVTNSNGLAWNLQDNTFYYIDTPTLQVAAFDFEPINGTICKNHLKYIA